MRKLRWMEISDWWAESNFILMSEDSISSLEWQSLPRRLQKHLRILPLVLLPIVFKLKFLFSYLCIGLCLSLDKGKQAFWYISLWKIAFYCDTLKGCFIRKNVLKAHLVGIWHVGVVSEFYPQLWWYSAQVGWGLGSRL